MRHEESGPGFQREHSGNIVTLRLPEPRGEPATEAPERKGQWGRPKMNQAGGVYLPENLSERK